MNGQLAQAFRIDALRDLCAEAFAVQERGVDVRSGVAGAIATVGPIAIAVATGNRLAGAIAALGGLNTALVVPRADWRSRLWWGGLLAIGGLGAVLLDDVVARMTWVLTISTFIWVSVTALLRGAGSAGALTGFALSAVFVILAGQAGGMPLGNRVQWFVAGAAGGLVLMLAARHGPRSQTPVGQFALLRVRDATLHDPTLRSHALRLGVAVAAGTAIERLLKMPHGYWVPLTVLAILQPAEHATNVRVVQRAAGTLVAVAVILVITAATGQTWVLIAFTSVAAFGLFALDERGYFWLVVMITPTALLMLSVSNFEGAQVGVERTLDSGLGIVVGLAIAEVGWRLGSLKAVPKRIQHNRHR